MLSVPGPIGEQHMSTARPEIIQRSFKVSRWIHKYLGLFLVLFLMWMSISGVLLNHPELISGISVPRWLIPSQYHLKNWNRSAMINLVFSTKDPRVAFAAGKAGVWKTVDAGESFTPMADGFPASPYYRKTKSIFLLEDPIRALFAGTKGGLFVNDLRDEAWRPMPLGAWHEEVVKIFRANDRIVVFTPSRAYASPVHSSDFNFQEVSLMREEPGPQVSLIKLFFDLHDGKAWGLPGKLLFDLAGGTLFFLSISAFYTWYFPWQRRRNKRSILLTHPTSRKVFKTLFKYHLKIGIWVCVMLLIMGGTGLFMRPPLLAVIARGNIPAGYYPGLLPTNPWHQKIHNALYDGVEDRILIQATDGLWLGPADFSAPFQRQELDIPVFVMGATVFEPYGSNGFLVGSFNGIFHVERGTGKPIDILTNLEVSNVSPTRPSANMVTGYFKTPAGEEFICTHKQGVLPVGNADARGRFAMPPELQSDFRMSLWNYLFEIHNGRFFKDLVGFFYILIVPVGSLLFLSITLSGIYDWLLLHVFRKRAPLKR
jgi:hypothetical protein